MAVNEMPIPFKYKVAVSEILPAHPLETEDSYLADMIRAGP